MANAVHLRSIIVDLDSCPTIETVSTARLPATDYSKILRKMTGINATSFTCSMICTIFDLIFALITLGVGAANQSSCPAEPRVPVYLVVAGSVNLLNISVSSVACTIHHRNQDEHPTRSRCVHGAAIVIIVLYIFSLTWLILGNIWVFRVFRDVQYTQVSLESYCKASVYQFTIASVILQYVLPFIFCCCKSLPCRS